MRVQASTPIIPTLTAKLFFGASYRSAKTANWHRWVKCSCAIRLRFSTGASSHTDRAKPSRSVTTKSPVASQCAYALNVFPSASGSLISPSPDSSQSPVQHALKNDEVCCYTNTGLLHKRENVASNPYEAAGVRTYTHCDLDWRHLDQTRLQFSIDWCNTESPNERTF